MGPDGSSLQVSGKFWVFWAFAIPVTFVVVAIFTLWIQRCEISDFARELLHSWYRRKSSNREPDIEDGREASWESKRKEAGEPKDAATIKE